MMHRATQNAMAHESAMQLVASFQATFVARKGAIDWYRMPSKEWLAVKHVGHGQCEVRRLPASACGCT